MPCTIKGAARNEKVEIANINPALSRMQRLKVLICGGGIWNDDNNINLIYWYPDNSMPKGGYWIAFEDPDPTIPAGVTITP